MAGARLHKFGSIFKRMNGLIQSGAVKYEDRPLWFDIYKAFPPEIEPDFERDLPDQNVRKILYPEDVIRKKIHDDYGQLDVVNLSPMKSATLRSQIFVETYFKMKEEGVEGNLFEATALKLQAEVKDFKLVHRTEMEHASRGKLLKAREAVRELDKEEFSGNLNKKQQSWEMNAISEALMQAFTEFENMSTNDDKEAGAKSEFIESDLFSTDSPQSDISSKTLEDRLQENSEESANRWDGPDTMTEKSDNNNDKQ